MSVNMQHNKEEEGLVNLFLSGFEAAKPHIFPKILRWDWNAARLANSPFRLFAGDLAVCYVVEYNGLVAYINNTALKAWEILPEVLDRAAIANIDTNEIEFVPCEKKMEEQTGLPAEMFPVPPVPVFFLGTKKMRTTDSRVILLPETIEIIKKKIGNTNFYLIPSSTAEWLVIPDDSALDPSGMADVIQTVNSMKDCVPSHMKLSDHPYLYTFEAGIVPV